MSHLTIPVTRTEGLRYTEFDRRFLFTRQNELWLFRHSNMYAQMIIEFFISFLFIFFILCFFFFCFFFVQVCKFEHVRLL